MARADCPLRGRLSTPRESPLDFPGILPDDQLMKFPLVAAALAFGTLALEASPIVREPGAIYLSDFAEKPLRLQLVREAPCYFDIGLSRYAGTLRFPQAVQVEAFAEHACRIRGNARQGGVAAWIPYADLEPLPKDFLENLRKAEDRRQQVEALIAGNEVAVGMTEQEVRRSVGRPQKKTRRADKDKVSQVWEYVRYQLIPQTTTAPGVSQTIVNIPGQTNQPPVTIIGSGPTWYSSTIWVKVPVGKLQVVFEDGIVESIEETEGTLLQASGARIVAPPLEVFW